MDELNGVPIESYPQTCPKIGNEERLEPKREFEKDLSDELDEKSSKEHSKSVFQSLSYCDSDDSDETEQVIEDPSDDYASQPPSESDIDETADLSEFSHDSSNKKKRSALLWVYHSQEKCKREEAYRAELNIKSTITEFDCKSPVSQAILSDGSQEECEGSSEKRRRSRWESQAERDDERTSKRRKPRWASDDWQLKMLGPIQLPDFAKDFVGSEFDNQIHELKLRLIEIKGKLINTRDARLREKLIQERQHIISTMIKNNPSFKTPLEYKPQKLYKKLYVPVKEYPTYNFIGVIIGPRGNTQKRLEKETGVKIQLRGKGSTKIPQKHDNSGDEDLHVYIEADNEESLDSAVMMVEKLLIPVDMGENDHKRAQLEELAKLNGTYRYVNMYGVCSEQKKTMHACATCGSLCHSSSSCPLTVSPKVFNAKSGSSSDANLYVGYIPSNVDQLGLKELFSRFGKIVEAKVIMDRTSSSSKGYGFVKFENPNDADVAVARMNGYKLGGKMLAVRIAGGPPRGGSQ